MVGFLVVLTTVSLVSVTEAASNPHRLVSWNRKTMCEQFILHFLDAQKAIQPRLKEIDHLVGDMEGKLSEMEGKNSAAVFATQINRLKAIAVELLEGGSQTIESAPSEQKRALLRMMQVAQFPLKGGKPEQFHFLIRYFQDELIDHLLENPHDNDVKALTEEVLTSLEAYYGELSVFLDRTMKAAKPEWQAYPFTSWLQSYRQIIIPEADLFDIADEHSRYFCKHHGDEDAPMVGSESASRSEGVPDTEL